MMINLIFILISLASFNSLISYTLRQLGTEYGGWVVPIDQISSDSICYSFGAGEDISFDLSLIETCGSHVYAFDPTPRSIVHINYIKNVIARNEKAFINNTKNSYSCSPSILDKFHFFPCGIWKENGKLKFYEPRNPQHVSYSLLNIQKTQNHIEVPCKSLTTIMQELGHDHLDLLKLDIEGAEFEVMQSMLVQQIYPKILCVEFHKCGEYTAAHSLMKLKNAGYVLIYQNKNNYTFVHELQKKSKPAMNIIEYAVELFPTDPVTTEHDAYTLLKEASLEQEVNYLAIPWAVLINKKQLDRIPSFKVNGGFTICQHIRYEVIIPLLEKMGIDTLFTPHVRKSRKYDKIKVLPFPHAAVHGADPAFKKDILYSFIGMKNHPTRSILFELQVPSDSIIKQRSSWHWWSGDKRLQDLESREYQDVLSRSRFSLCPRGTGASTLRFWESLQAGAIPVHIADDCILPSGVNWKECIIEVPEKNVCDIDALIRRISPEKEAHMRKKCIEAFEQFSGKNFVSVIRSYYSHKK